LAIDLTDEGAFIAASNNPNAGVERSIATAKAVGSNTLFVTIWMLVIMETKQLSAALVPRPGPITNV